MKVVFERVREVVHSAAGVIVLCNNDVSCCRLLPWPADIGHQLGAHRCPCGHTMQTINWLRHGVTPIGVAEGLAPAEKLATLQACILRRNSHIHTCRHLKFVWLGHEKRR